MKGGVLPPFHPASLMCEEEPSGQAKALRMRRGPNMGSQGPRRSCGALIQHGGLLCMRQKQGRVNESLSL